MRHKKAIFITVAILLAAFAIFFYIRFYFVFGEGVKAGELNYFVRKGYIFKTYEGNLIQTGFKGKAAGTIQSIEFRFSVTDKEVADSLFKLSGRNMELHYKEYLAPLPWRGMSVNIVDKIISVSSDTNSPEIIE